jgi:hypothetical protein
VHEPARGILEEPLHPEARLRHHVHRALLEGVERHLGPRPGEPGADDDGQGSLRHQLLQEREPVHPRHLDVEHHHVGRLAPHLVHRDDGVVRGDDLHPDVAEDLGERLAHDRGVVHHEDAEPLGAHALGSPGARW